MCVHCGDAQQLRAAAAVDKLRDRLALYYLAEVLGEASEEAGNAFYAEVHAMLNISSDGDAALAIALLLQCSARELADQLRAEMVESLERVK